MWNRKMLLNCKIIKKVTKIPSQITKLAVGSWLAQNDLSKTLNKKQSRRSLLYATYKKEEPVFNLRYKAKERSENHTHLCKI